MQVKYGIFDILWQHARHSAVEQISNHKATWNFPLFVCQSVSEWLLAIVVSDQSLGNQDSWQQGCLLEAAEYWWPSAVQCEQGTYACKNTLDVRSLDLDLAPTSVVLNYIGFIISIIILMIIIRRRSCGTVRQRGLTSSTWRCRKTAASCCTRRTGNLPGGTGRVGIDGPLFISLMKFCWNI